MYVLNIIGYAKSLLWTLGYAYTHTHPCTNIYTQTRTHIYSYNITIIKDQYHRNQSHWYHYGNRCSIQKHSNLK